VAAAVYVTGLPDASGDWLQQVDVWG